LIGNPRPDKSQPGASPSPEAFANSSKPTYRRNPDVSQVGTIAKRFRGIDCLVNNAGIVLVKGVEECFASEWDQAMAVNVRSVFLMVKYALSWRRSSPQPAVVNIGSISSIIAQQGIPAYITSKGAVLMLSKALALDLAPDRMRLNCVCPGITDTPMFRFHVNSTPDPERTLRELVGPVPLQRQLAPREIAGTVLYLAGPESTGINGTSVVVDGGYTAAAEWSQP
jgi:NAD(P)-dependent dehydrogenase (short-subunit alcohol dehydrogenase family)